MPWVIRKRGNQHCVVKEGETTPVPGGCHATRAEAVRHQRALYAGEASLLLEAAQEAADRRTKNGVEFGGIPPHSTPMVDRPWDGPSQVAKLPNPVGRAKARKMYAWVDPNKNQDVKAAYHFPHHEVSDSGEVGPANIAGVRIGLSRVPQAHIPEADRAGARAHLQRHLDDWHRKQGRAAQMPTGDPNPLWTFLGPQNNWTTPPYVPQIYYADNTSGIAWVPATATAPDPELEDMPEGDQWEGVLAVEGLATSDGRYLMPGKVGHRDLPLTLMCQTITDEGHKGAFAAGKITEITREDRPDLGENAVAIVGHGVFADTEEGRKAQALLADEIVRGVSIDFSPTNSMLLDPDTLEEIPDDEMDLMELLHGNYVRGFEGNIMGATLCPFPAFEDATLQIVEATNRLVIASAFPMRKVLTASAAGMAPLTPPYDWFFQPEPPGPFPLTVMDDGRVMGHLALWNQCHRGIADQCEMAPRSRSGYAFFHTGAITTDDGRKVNVGRVTVGDGGHASVSPYVGTKAAVEHYDKTGMVGAFVRATDGAHGIWLSGVVRSDCPAEKVRDMQANPPSGDWREENGRLELCAALSVPVAGFPVPRYEAALVASGESERVVAIVMSGYAEPGKLTRAGQRRIETLKTAARTALDAWDDGFRDVSTAERKRLAKTGGAMPDGSFPIANCQDAKNARQAIGRAAPGKRAAVRSHIERRESALGCSKDD